MTIDYAAQVLANITLTESGCWRFGGYILPNGYGQVGRNLGAHRVVWKHVRGPVPDGMVLDHECHNRDETCNAGNDCLHRRCVNPDHLAVVTRGMNALTGRSTSALNMVKTHCPEGHEYTPENTYERPDRWGRLCRTCRVSIDQRFMERHRDKLAARQRDYRRNNPELYRAYGRERHRRQRLGLSTKGLFAELSAAQGGLRREVDLARAS